MRISYLLIVFGDTGGSMVLYKFMDKLCERGHEVFAITPTERIPWGPHYSHTLLERFSPAKPRRGLRRLAGKVVSPLRQMLRARLAKSQSPLERTVGALSWTIQGLLKNWVPSDITVSTFCSTAYANYALMEKTIPVYHMQHYEEVFMDCEESMKMARLTYFLPQVLIANSLWLQSQIKQRIGKESHLLNPGIDQDTFYPREELEKKYSNPDKIKIVSYYSPVKFKAWEDAVSAMQIVFKKLPENKIEWIVFGGTPPMLPDLPVRFVGKVYKDTLAELYSKAHIVFMNSWHESFPLPPLEAMACGTAVACTRIGTEDYAHDQKNSLVVPPRKPELLAQALLKLIENPRLALRLAKAGLETANQFGWNEATDRLEAIFKKALQFSDNKKFVDLADLVAGHPSG